MGVGDGATGLGLCTLGWGGGVFALVFKRALYMNYRVFSEVIPAFLNV